MVVHTNTSNSRAGIFITVASTLKQLKTAGEVNIPSFLKQAPTRGQHLLRHWATTQNGVTLSSGEAELGASEVLGLQSVAADLGLDMAAHVRTDSSAALGMC